MATDASGSEPVERIGVLVRVHVQRHDVITFQSASSTTIDTAPGVALKDLLSRELPAPGVELGVKPASRMPATHPTLPP